MSAPTCLPQAINNNNTKVHCFPVIRFRLYLRRSFQLYHHKTTMDMDMLCESPNLWEQDWQNQLLEESWLAGSPCSQDDGGALPPVGDDDEKDFIKLSEGLLLAALGQPFGIDELTAEEENLFDELLDGKIDSDAVDQFINSPEFAEVDKFIGSPDFADVLRDLESEPAPFDDYLMSSDDEEQGQVVPEHSQQQQQPPIKEENSNAGELAAADDTKTVNSPTGDSAAAIEAATPAETTMTTTTTTTTPTFIPIYTTIPEANNKRPAIIMSGDNAVTIESFTPTEKTTTPASPALVPIYVPTTSTSNPDAIGESPATITIFVDANGSVLQIIQKVVSGDETTPLSPAAPAAAAATTSSTIDMAAFEAVASTSGAVSRPIPTSSPTASVTGSPKAKRARAAKAKPYERPSSSNNSSSWEDDGGSMSGSQSSSSSDKPPRLTRKRGQNRTAANRYRQKKREENSKLDTEMEGLTETNKELHGQVTQLSNEIGYLKGLMRDILVAKGLVKK